MVTPAHLCLTTTTAQYLRAIELTPQSQFASELCVSDEQPVIPYHAHTLIMVSQTSNGETFLLETSRASALQTVTSQPENPFAKLIPDQQIVVIPSFELESGVTLQNVPIAYTTRGKLSERRDNALVICHALSGSADVADWWGPLMGGPGQAFDITRFFVVCLNCLGSPYGSASPVTYKNGKPELGRYGPEFPLTTVRDDANIHKLVLDDLGVNQVATVVGGSMGVPIATSARHSAWGISWGEAQRQSIYSDPKYEDGYYTFEDPPTTGLGAARMSAMLTYRSRDSFESRFGRNTPDASKGRSINGAQNGSLTPTNEHWSIHNHGHKSTRSISRPASSNGIRNGENHVLTPEESMAEKAATITDPQFSGTTLFAVPAFESKTNKPMHHYYSAQSYLRYQGTKFVGRFDANCYIAITRKLDTHDVARNRAETVKEALQQIKQPTLILGIESDGLFTFAEQEELADGIPNNKLRKIDSPEGHDAFLLQFEQVNKYLLDFFREVLPEIMERQVDGAALEEASDGVGKLTKSSVFGEAEVEDLTAW